MLDEQIQNNCKQIQELLKLNKGCGIFTMRVAEDKCRILERRTKKIIYDWSSQEKLTLLEKIIEDKTTSANEAFQKLQEMTKSFSNNNIRAERIDKYFCIIRFPTGPIVSQSFCLNNNIDERIEDIKNIYKEQSKS